MSYCISPTCPAPNTNSPTTNFCMSCGAKILLKDRYQSAAEVVKLLKNSAPVIIVDRTLTLHQLTTVSKEVWREFNSSLTLEISFQVSNLTSLSTGLG